MKDMTSGNPVKLILLFSLPLLIGNIFQQFYSMVDTIIVGRFLGVEALAAVGNTGSLSFLVNGFVLGLSSGFSVLISQKFGANDKKGLKRATSSAITLTIISTIFITILSTVLTKPLLTLMNTPSDIFQGSYDYIIVIFAGIFCTVIYNFLASILRALGDSKTPLYFLIIASILNIVLDVVFIVNFSMGVAGAAYATVISQGVSGLLCIVYTYKKFDVLNLTKEDFNVKKHYYTRHIRIAIPMALQFSVTAVGIMIVQAALNVLGSVAIAAYTAASKVLQLVMQPHVTFGVTMVTYCGQNLGAKQFTRIKEGIKKCALMSIVVSCIASFVLVVFGENLVRIFIDNPSQEILAYAKEYLNWTAIFFIPLGFIFVYRNSLQGMGESFVPMMGGVLELVARALTAFILPAYIGYTGICLSDPAAWIAASVPLMTYYMFKINKLIRENPVSGDVAI